jgi:hypothetical protein
VGCLEFSVRSRTQGLGESTWPVRSWRLSLLLELLAFRKLERLLVVFGAFPSWHAHRQIGCKKTALTLGEDCGVMVVILSDIGSEGCVPVPASASCYRLHGNLAY